MWIESLSVNLPVQGFLRKRTGVQMMRKPHPDIYLKLLTHPATPPMVSPWQRQIPSLPPRGGNCVVVKALGVVVSFWERRTENGVGGRITRRIPARAEKSQDNTRPSLSVWWSGVGRYVVWWIFSREENYLLNDTTTLGIFPCKETSNSLVLFRRLAVHVWCMYLHAQVSWTVFSVRQQNQGQLEGKTSLVVFLRLCYCKTCLCWLHEGSEQYLM